jgi:hypothetical protein
VFAAREFVWWYNAHPDGRQLPVDLSKVEAVAVCGIGNVALDCARLLLRPPDQLAATDIAMHALQQLRSSSRVREVHLCARRGPVQVSCCCLCRLPRRTISFAPCFEQLFVHAGCAKLQTHLLVRRYTHA